MNFYERYSRRIAVILCLTLVLQLTSCGTIIYPERKGQAHGKVDTVVAVIDGLGLLLFVIPGLIAFGVDVYTGALYLPPGVSSSKVNSDDEEPLLDKEARVYRLAPEALNVKGIEDAISDLTGESIRLGAENVIVRKFESKEALLHELAKADAGLRGEFKTALAAN